MHLFSTGAIKTYQTPKEASNIILQFGGRLFLVENQHGSRAVLLRAPGKNPCFLPFQFQ